MAAAAIPAITGAYGIYAGERANAQAGDYADLQRKAYLDDLAMRRQFMEEQQRLYGPVEQSLVREASSPLPLNYGPVSGAIQRNYDTAGRGLNVSMAQRGLSGSPVEAATSAGLQLGRAGALSQAFSQGLQQRLALAQGVLQRFQPAQNVQMTSQGLGQLGGFYGQQAGLWGGAAQQGYSNAATALGNLAQTMQTQSYLDKMKQGNIEGMITGPETAPTDVPMMPEVAQPIDYTRGVGGFRFGDMPAQPGLRFGATNPQPSAWSGGLGVGTSTTSVK